MNTPHIEPYRIDKLKVEFGYKTDTNITVMSTVSLKKVKLTTGSCFVCIPDLNWLKIPHVELVKVHAFWRSG